MKLFILLAVTFVAACAQSNKDKFDQRIIDLGLTFFTKAEVAKITTCMEDSVYNQKSMDDLKSDGMNCVLKSCSMTKYANVMDLMSKMDNCLKPIPEKTMALIDKVTPAGKKAMEPKYNQLMTAIGKSKAAKKTKAQTVDEGYAILLNQATKAFVDDVCTDLFKNAMNKVEVNCCLTIGPKLVNVNGYSCAKIVKTK